MRGNQVNSNVPKSLIQGNAIGGGEMLVVGGGKTWRSIDMLEHGWALVPLAIVGTGVVGNCYTLLYLPVSSHIIDIPLKYGSSILELWETYEHRI